MSLCSVGMSNGGGRICNCTGYLTNPGGKCCMELSQGPVQAIGDSISWPYNPGGLAGAPYQNNYEIESLKGRINAQEHTINHTQEGIEKCFERLEKLEYVLGDVFERGERIRIKEKEMPKKPYDNIFEFIAVDPKRRDDIRHVKNALYELYCWILDNIQDNKYRSNGIDLLEAAAMQLNKAISRRKDNGT